MRVLQEAPLWLAPPVMLCDPLRELHARLTALPANAKPHTPEQEREARAIVVCKTHYEVLSIDKNADDSEVKKAYRKVRTLGTPSISK